MDLRQPRPVFYRLSFINGAIDLMPRSKGDYVRCAWMPRYCSKMCPHTLEERDDQGKVWLWCRYAENAYGKTPIPIIKKEVAGVDDFGNIYLAGVIR
jgi:hypothetical protein